MLILNESKRQSTSLFTSYFIVPCEQQYVWQNKPSRIFISMSLATNKQYLIAINYSQLNTTRQCNKNSKVGDFCFFSWAQNKIETLAKKKHSQTSNLKKLDIDDRHKL